MQTGRSRLLVGVAFATTAMLATAAQAQDATGATSEGLADIIVTAQRRAEVLQDVPISITAADAAQLADARVESITNLSAITPSVDVRAGGLPSESNVIIRGLGTTGTSRAFEGSAGVFIDGVYRTRASAAMNTFLDIGNLQVLRGPQGTLFGKNTTAGAILVQTTAPSIDAPEMSIDLGYGNYNSVLVRGAVNMPVGNSFAVRVAGAISHNDGFYVDTTSGSHYNDNSTQAVKAQLLFEPNDGVRIRLIGDYLRSHGDCCYGSSDYLLGPRQFIVDQIATEDGYVLSPRDGKPSFHRGQNGHNDNVSKDYGATLLMDFDIGESSLHSITAYRRYDVDQKRLDGDRMPIDLFRYSESSRSKFFSQELTFNTHIDAVNGDLVLGAFFSDEKLRMPRVVDWGADAQRYWDLVFLNENGLPPGTVYAGEGLWYDEDMRASAKSYAGFAHLDMEVVSNFNIILGARYSIEKKTGSFHYNYYLPQPNEVLRVVGLRPGPAYDDSTTNKALSGTVGLQYKPTSDIMLYATYNRGFKAGGVNTDPNAAGARANNPDEVPGGVPLSPIYAPEKINAYEIGGKFQYFNRRARTNISAFYYDISDFQVAQYLGIQFAVLNAKSAKDYGVEIENLFELMDGVTLGLDGTWIPHAKYGDDPKLAQALRTVDRFRLVPKFRGNATLNFDLPVSATLNLTGRVQYQRIGSQYGSTASTGKIPAVNLLNANLGVKLPESNIQLEAWVLNLTNKTYVATLGAKSFQGDADDAFLGPPRTFGVRLRANF